MPKLKNFGSPGKNLESFFHDRPELLSSGDWSSPCEIAVKRKKLLPLNDLTLLVLGQVLEKHSLLLWTKTTFVKIVATNPNKQPLMLKKKRGHDFFFELMPCALEAQTVIKTFCL